MVIFAQKLLKSDLNDGNTQRQFILQSFDPSNAQDQQRGKTSAKPQTSAPVFWILMLGVLNPTPHACSQSRLSLVQFVHAL
jgi:hypothetical protein